MKPWQERILANVQRGCPRAEHVVVKMHGTRWKMIRGLSVALALAFLLAGTVPSPAQDFLRKSLATPGEARPINISADHVATWTEGGWRLWLLSGRAKV